MVPARVRDLLVDHELPRVASAVDDDTAVPIVEDGQCDRSDVSLVDDVGFDPRDVVRVPWIWWYSLHPRGASMGM